MVSGKMVSANGGVVEVGTGMDGEPMWKMGMSCLGKESQFLKVRLPAVQKLAPVSHQEAERGGGQPLKVEK